MTKKLTAAITAMALTLPLLPTAHADYPLPAAGDPTEVTVVAKQIKNGDTYDPYYVEISLEVNYDYEDYSAVGVVLQYDPEIITPAESWDGDNGAAAKMDGNTSWATRRALPTLGSDKWTTHTALAYETTDDSNKKVGYLYLGAEYPGVEPMGSPDPSASPAASPNASPAAADPSASPDPDIYVNPVVVARFVYTHPYDKDTNTGLKPEDFANKWDTGITSTTPASSWDNDWTKNEYLTIAPDKIAAESPAEFGFAYYGSDLSERAYMASFPPAITPTPSPDPSATPTATPAAAATSSPAATIGPYTPPPVGARIQENDRMVAKHIVIVRGEGKSAKATGGLKLSDIYSIIFLDWDNSILGVTTAAVGVDMAETVDSFVQAKWVHPTLKGKNVGGDVDYEEHVDDGTWLDRQWSYRGEYPYDGPRTDGIEPKYPGSDNRSLIFPDYDPDIVLEEGDEGVLLDDRGSRYPITNKLDYVLAGKDIDPKHPFAYGWTQVLTEDVDWWQLQADNPGDESLAGEKPNYMPKSMDNTWSVLENWEMYTYPSFDSDGNYDWATMGDDVRVPPIDYSNITKDTLKYSDGNLYLKAVYKPDNVFQFDPDETEDANYAVVGPIKRRMIGDVYADNYTLGIDFQYRRINNAGYGVTKARIPAVNFAMQQIGASGQAQIKLDVTDGDVIDVTLTPSNYIDMISYQLREIFESNVIEGNTLSRHSSEDELGDIQIAGPYGEVYRYAADIILKDVYEYADSGDPGGTWIEPINLQIMRLSRTANGMDYVSNLNARNAQTPLIEMAKEAKDLGYDYKDINWFQMQYAVLRTEAPYFNEDAETFFWNNEGDYSAVMEKAGLYGYYP